jgi:hypothetical protein
MSVAVLTNAMIAGNAEVLRAIREEDVSIAIWERSHLQASRPFLSRISKTSGFSQRSANCHKNWRPRSMTPGSSAASGATCSSPTY